MKSLARFPWKLFWQIFVTQIFLYNLLFVVSLGIVSSYRPFGQGYFWSIVLQYFLASTVLAFVLAWRFSKPLHQIILKAFRIATKKFENQTEDDEDLLDEELGEYAQIENALNRIHRKLKKRHDQLQLEREETQSFMSAVQDGVVSVSPDLRVLYFNSQFATHFLDSAQMHSHLMLADVFRHPEIHDGFLRALKEGRTFRVQLKLETKLDKNSHYFSVSVNPLRKSKTHEVYGAMGIFHDITELKKAELVRIEFVGNASHELRTPLTSIKGYVDTLKADIKGGHFEQAAKFIDIISKNVERLADLVNDLLSISTLESNAEIKIEPVNPLVVSEHIVSELAQIVREKNQVIMVVGAQDIPSFNADLRKVEQVLRNLVSNAVKYIPAEKTVQIRWEKGELGNVVLRVIDNGPGIPAEHHDRLFERFYRIDKGRSRDAGGTGLGLAIVKHIMQSHGGTVQVKSAMGQGSEFICTFPVKNMPAKV
ncbi:sensor histidine kinase [Bdellovibrio sp. HCB337]|uniref:sensor histidine kinase n=1 Tax=Bdellovibrio sp. HCB337 TaxID=3394358 RepID=UPI0039A53814